MLCSPQMVQLMPEPLCFAIRGFSWDLWDIRMRCVAPEVGCNGWKEGGQIGGIPRLECPQSCILPSPKAGKTFGMPGILATIGVGLGDAVGALQLRIFCDSMIWQSSVWDKLSHLELREQRVPAPGAVGKEQEMLHHSAPSSEEQVRLLSQTSGMCQQSSSTHKSPECPKSKILSSNEFQKSLLATITSG